MPAPIDLMGMRFGRLTVIKPLPRDGTGSRKWLCHCKCGSQYIASSGALKRRLSCGCLRGVASAKAQGRELHGGSESVEFKTWVNMKRRCAESPTYKKMGIKVCPRWRGSFTTFLADMGRRPDNCTSIDRINNNGDYEPGNCRWATAKMQANNRSNNRYLTLDGETKCAAEWARLAGITRGCLGSRLRRGVILRKALNLS